MKISTKVFRSRFKSWEILFEEAAKFASKLTPDTLVSISHSCDQQDSVVVVWYWGK